MENEDILHLKHLVQEEYIRKNGFLKRLKKISKKLKDEEKEILRKDFTQFYNLKIKDTSRILLFGFLKLKKYCNKKNIQLFVTNDFKISLKKKDLRWKYSNLFSNNPQDVFSKFQKKFQNLQFDSNLLMIYCFNNFMKEMNKYLQDIDENQLNEILFQKFENITIPSNKDLKRSKKLFHELMPNFLMKIDISEKVEDDEDDILFDEVKKFPISYHQISSNFKKILNSKNENSTDITILKNIFPRENIAKNIKSPILLIKPKNSTNNFQNETLEKIEKILNEIIDLKKDNDNFGVLYDPFIWLKHIFYPENEEYKILLEISIQVIELEKRQNHFKNEKYLTIEEDSEDSYHRTQINDIMEQIDSLNDEVLDENLMNNIWNRKFDEMMEVLKNEEEKNFNLFKSIEDKLKKNENGYLEHHIYIHEIFRFLEFIENCNFDLFSA
eukprot:gene9549-1753_t